MLSEAVFRIYQSVITKYWVKVGACDRERVCVAFAPSPYNRNHSASTITATRSAEAGHFPTNHWLLYTTLKTKMSITNRTFIHTQRIIKNMYTHPQKRTKDPPYAKVTKKNHKTNNNKINKTHKQTKQKTERGQVKKTNGTKHLHTLQRSSGERYGSPLRPSGQALEWE